MKTPRKKRLKVFLDEYPQLTEAEQQKLGEALASVPPGLRITPAAPYRATPDPGNPGKWQAHWPGGSSSGWASEATALEYARSMRLKNRSRTPMDLKPIKDAP